MRSAIKHCLGAFLSVALVSPAIAQADRWAGDGGLPPFYHWAGALPAKPGKMLRVETAPAEVTLPAAGRAVRILYSSTDWRNRAQRIAVSGIVFFPKGKAPKGGWPVIAWAHGTTGIADVCAPSFMPRSPRDATFFSHWLEAGYAIVAADYQGLGSPGVHPYLHYDAEGIGVLDSIRAATGHYRELSRDRIVTMGQSQGSEGAIAAAYLAPSYAPEIRLKGTVATGIVAQTKNVRNAPQEPLPSLWADDGAYGNSAYEILWFLGTARSINPDAVSAEEYVSDEGRAMLEKAQTTCMGGLRAYANEIRLPLSRFYKRSSDPLEVLVAKSTLFPDAAIRTPVFVGTGLADGDALPAKQYNFVSAMCAAGTKVEWHYYPRATHSSAVERSLADSPAFVSRVMNGEAVAGNCAALVPPGPLQSAE
jgi:hypothetical protein